MAYTKPNPQIGVEYDESRFQTSLQFVRFVVARLVIGDPVEKTSYVTQQAKDCCEQNRTEPYSHSHAINVVQAIGRIDSLNACRFNEPATA